ncbi:hypothetical protein [Phenylobacterium sp.]|uniref:hypothetical protein n=1 Tax=Phenylobacterium sp. TaxID=1871053 RepID=UPI0025F962DD|nr:hypothetical protein [Phenylobacterium sp.]MCA6360750.1 hypothetical protein [Phenylobacterium sp.]
MIGEWVRVRRWLLPALTDATEAEVVSELLTGRATLWPGERAAFVTTLITDPARMHVWLGGGDGAEMLAMIAGMAAWGRAQGAQWATVNGRRGWKRRLRDFGFEPRNGELWKAL